MANMCHVDSATADRMIRSVTRAVMYGLYAHNSWGIDRIEQSRRPIAFFPLQTLCTYLHNFPFIPFSFVFLAPPTLGKLTPPRWFT